MSVVNPQGASDSRFQLMQRWLESLELDIAAVEPASSDASFRRYFRVDTVRCSLIVMDAPPGREDTGPFVQVARLFRAAGIHVPEIMQIDAENGFLLISDMGSSCYLGGLDEHSAPGLYRDAMAAIGRLQANVDIDRCGLPAYDEALLRREFEIFSEWFLYRKLNFDRCENIHRLLQDLQECLVESALEQPRVCVHRDFHSRNLMIVESENPGILDFQDAVIGPLSYDLVSLLRDCYIAWSPDRVETWVRDYHDRYCPEGLSLDRFTRWFDLMGLQRHLKAVGIFSRLQLRDGKANYLADIPRTMSYVSSVCSSYPELAEFNSLLNNEVLGRMAAELAE